MLSDQSRTMDEMKTVETKQIEILQGLDREVQKQIETLAQKMEDQNKRVFKLDKEPELLRTCHIPTSLVVPLASQQPSQMGSPAGTSSVVTSISQPSQTGSRVTGGN